MRLTGGPPGTLLEACLHCEVHVRLTPAQLTESLVEVHREAALSPTRLEQVRDRDRELVQNGPKVMHRVRVRCVDHGAGVTHLEPDIPGEDLRRECPLVRRRQVHPLTICVDRTGPDPVLRTRRVW